MGSPSDRSCRRRPRVGLLRGRWLGRRVLFWLADAVLIPLFIALAVLTDDSGMRVVAGLLVVSRLVTIGVIVEGARRSRAADDARLG